MRSSIPAISLPPGAQLFSNGGSHYTILGANQPQPGNAIMNFQTGPGMPNATSNAYRQPPPFLPPPPYFAAQPQYVVPNPESIAYPPNAVYVQQYYPTAPYAPAQFAMPVVVPYSNNGQNYLQPQQTSIFTGPPALELQAPPTVLPPPRTLPPSQSSHVPTNFQPGINGAMSNVVMRHPQQQVHNQKQLPPRPKKILAIVDPKTKENVMNDTQKANELQNTSINNDAGGNQGEQLTNQHISENNAPTASIEPNQSRSGSSTPHLLEQQQNVRKMSERSLSRGPSPAPEQSQKKKEAALSEFYEQFAQQLYPTEAHEQLHSSHKDDTELMPPPPPPIRTSSRNSSRHSSTRTPPSTPPPLTSAPVQFLATNPSKMAPLEFGIGASFSIVPSSQPRVEFGWSDKSIDSENSFRSPSPQQQTLDANNSGYDRCSTPSKVPPPFDLPRSRSPLLTLNSGHEGATIPKSPLNQSSFNEAQAQQLLIENQSVSKDGCIGSCSSAPSIICERSNDAYQDDSLEEGEIRDITFERSDSARPTASMTEEEKDGVSGLIDQLKALEEPSGRRCYSYEFMQVAAKLPSSKMRPNFETSKWSADNINEVFNLNRQSAIQARMENIKSRTLPFVYNTAGAVGFNVPWMAPPFVNVMPGRKAYPGRLSADAGVIRGDRNVKGVPRQGLGGGRSVMPKQPPIVIARSSLEVELKSAGGNAWKPSHKVEATDDKEQAEIQKLFKEVRGILNKITPQTFAELFTDFLELEVRVNTAERAVGVVDIFFQKAVDEPAFCAIYSDLFDKVAKHQLKRTSQTSLSKEISFRWILLNKCQAEFEREKKTETTKLELEETIQKAETEEQKKQLREDLDEFLMKEKRRTLGNVRFIGELYLRSMLTGKIMHRCVMGLLKNKDEESLECLCKLLTTMGQKLDGDLCEFQDNAGSYYTRLKEVSSTVCSRIRFMILDLLDLRANSWQPRRKGEGPKTIQQLHLDAEKEKREQQQQLLQQVEEKEKQEKQEYKDSRKNVGRRDGPNRSSYGVQERQEDNRGMKPDRGAQGRDKDQYKPGGRQGGGLNLMQQRPAQPSADSSKAKAPALSQHLGNMNSDVRLGPSSKGWNKPKQTSSIVQSQQPSVDHEVNSERRNSNVDAGKGSRASSQTRQNDESVLNQENGDSLNAKSTTQEEISSI